MRRIAGFGSRDISIALLIVAGVTFSTCVHAFVRERSARNAFLSDEIVRVWIPSRDRAAATMRSTELARVREGAVFRVASAYLTSTVALELSGATWESPSAAVNPEFWRVFGVRPLRGRVFDERDAVSSSEIAMISSDLWKVRFRSDPDVVGRPLRVSGQTVTIVGVAPDGFAYPGRGTAIWLVLPNAPPEGTTLQYPVVARLSNETSLAAAAAALGSTLRDLLAGPEEVRIQPVHDFELADVRPYLVLLEFLGFLFVALVAGNVVCLLWLSQVDQIRSMAIKMTLGASPSRLIATQLRRVAVLALAAGCIAALAVYVFLNGARAFELGETLRLHRVAEDGAPVMLAFLSAVIVAGASAGVSSLLVVQRAQAGPAREGLRKPWPRLAQRGVLLLQLLIPLSILPVGLLHGSNVIALAAAGRHLLDPGMVALKVKLPDHGYGANTTQIAAIRTIFDNLAAKGVRDAAITNVLPVTGSRTLRTVKAHARPYTEDAMSTVDLRIASPSLLPMMNSELIAGRFLRESDVFGSTPSVVVDSLLARQVFGENVEPGPRITLGQRPWEIVGIVEPFRESLATELQPTLWVPYQQLENLQMSADYLTTFWLVFRAEKETTAADVKAVIGEVAPGAVSGDPSSLAYLAYSGVADRVGYASVAVLSGGVALLLSIAGLYGVSAARVRLLERELATRSAIGAGANHLAWVCVRDAVFALPLAVCLGWLANRTFAAFAPGAAPAGALSPAGAMLLTIAIVLAGLLAALWRPIRIGRSVSPLLALRSEV